MLYKTITDSIYPDEPEDKPICYCSKCENELYAGNEYITYCGEIICEFCLDDFTTGDWLELIGVSKEIVGPDMFNDYAYDRYDD